VQQQTDAGKPTTQGNQTPSSVAIHAMVERPRARVEKDAVCGLMMTTKYFFEQKHAAQKGELASSSERG
jgi:hypothetical protein